MDMDFTDRLALAAILSAGLTGQLHAQSQAPLPPPVEAVAREARNSCTVGGPAKLAPGFFQTVDFNGDGQPDYVLDFKKAECTNSPPGFCGSGGCRIEAFVSSLAGYRDMHLDILGFTPKIEVKDSMPVLIIAQRAGRVSYRWNGRTLKAGR